MDVLNLTTDQETWYKSFLYFGLEGLDLMPGLVSPYVRRTLFDDTSLGACNYPRVLPIGYLTTMYGVFPFYDKDGALYYQPGVINFEDNRRMTNHHLRGAIKTLIDDISPAQHLYSNTGLVNLSHSLWNQAPDDTLETFRGLSRNYDTMLAGFYSDHGVMLPLSAVIIQKSEDGYGRRILHYHPFLNVTGGSIEFIQKCAANSLSQGFRDCFQVRAPMDFSK